MCTGKTSVLSIPHTIEISVLNSKVTFTISYEIFKEYIQCLLDAGELLVWKQYKDPQSAKFSRPLTKNE